MVKKIFIEIRLLNLMTYYFKRGNHLGFNAIKNSKRNFGSTSKKAET